MRKRNNKKRAFYTVLLIVIAVLVVGYAALSSVLNIFGGLAIVGGNSFDIRWSNVMVSDEGNVDASIPTISNSEGGVGKRVDFSVNLSNLGDSFVFTVDAENVGTIDAMIESVDYAIYDEDDEIVEPSFLNYSVSYANDVQISSNHLLPAGQTATYKVKVEYSADGGDDLPDSEVAYRFAFSVTYIQADDTAYTPGDSALPDIPSAIDYGNVVPNGTYYRLNTRTVSVHDPTDDLGPLFTDANDMPNSGGFDFALKHTISNDDISNVGFVFRYNNVISNVTWDFNCYDGTMKNSLSNIFQGNCTDSGYDYSCYDEDTGLDVTLYDTSEMTVTNGVYMCNISSEGESYCTSS